MLNINWLTTDCNVDSRLLTCGNDKLTYEQNVDIFNYAFEYIRLSNTIINAWMVIQQETTRIM
jgi:hypothetical protein